MENKMKLVLIPMLIIILATSLARASSSVDKGLKSLKAGCEEVDESLSLMEQRTAAGCFDGLKERNYNLRINYIEDYLQYISSEADTYKVIFPMISSREEKFKRFAEQDCEISSYCGGSCGTGDDRGGHGCFLEELNKRSVYLDSEIEHGIGNSALYLPFTTNHIYLHTDKFIIELKSNCKTGLFLCENIKYVGKNKSTKKSISLNGEPFFGYKKGNGSYRQLGVYFINGNYEYFVYFEGSLKVVNTKENKTILKAKGAWKNNP